MRQKITWGIAGTILTFGLLWGAWKITSGPTQQAEVKSFKMPLNAKDWTLGSKKAKNTLIEYSDFQCPACKSYNPLIKKLAEDQKDNLLVVYRHYPLPQHKNSKVAAYAAEAAGAQGKFFEMGELLFENQEKWGTKSNPQPDFESFAKKLKLNLEQFKTDSTSKETKDRVEADIVSGNQFQVNATPSFYMNGKRVTNPGSLDDFVKLLQK